MKIVSKKITEATVNNLTPGREYEFMVLSQDKHGDGMFSKTVRVLTDPGISHFVKISPHFSFQCNLRMKKIIKIMIYKYKRSVIRVNTKF